MPELLLIPDSKQLVVDYLLDRPEAVAALGGERIYTVLPNSPVWPAVRINRVRGVPLEAQPLYVDQPVLQVTTFGWTGNPDDEHVDVGMGPIKAVNRIGETCRAVLDEIPRYSFEGAVVTAATFGTLHESEDPTWTPARPFSRFVVTLTLHPVAVPTS